MMDLYTRTESDIASSVKPRTEPVGTDPITAIEFDAVVGYKLSDAIRDGAQATKQEVGGWGNGHETACALTAAQRAIDERGYGLR